MSLIKHAVLSALSMLLVSGSAWAVPAVTVAPVVTPPNTKVTVTGTGFGIAEAVDIYFDTVDVCLAISDGTGKATCSITVPRDAQPQQHWVTALQRGGQGAQTPLTVRTDMPQFHGRTAAHAGVNPFENTLNVSNAGDLDTLWQQDLGTSFYASPVVANGVVYAAGGDGQLYAFNAVNGAPVAGFPILASPFGIVGSTPAVGNGRIFVGGDDNKLHAYTLPGGAAAAGFPITLPAAVRSPPALALGNVYVGCNDLKIHAFNATTGAPVPGFPVVAAPSNSSLTASPTIAGGRVFIAASNSSSGLISGFNATTGATATGYPKATGGVPADNSTSTIAAVSGMAFVGSTDVKLYGFNQVFGADLEGFPQTQFVDRIHGSPAIAGSKLFVASRDGKLSAIRLGDGATLWTTTIANGTNTSVYGSPMVANGVVYIANSRALYALSAASGSQLWRAGVVSNGLGILNSPVVANGIVYFASTDGNVYAFSVNGLAPSARLPGGALGVKPAMAALKPNLSLKPGQSVLASAPAEDD